MREYRRIRGCYRIHVWQTGREDNLPLLPAHFFHYLRHQLFPHATAFQAGINIGMFDNAEVFAGGNKTISATGFPARR